MNWTRWQLEEWQRRQMKLPEPPPLTGDCVEKEQSLHHDIMDWCLAQWPQWCFIRARMDKPSTIGLGIHDITIFAPGGKVLCIECKAKNRKRTVGQEAWAMQMEKLGFTVHCIRSWSQFQQLIQCL